MNREIKFRAWYEKEKKMISVDELLNLWSQSSGDMARTPDVRAISQKYNGNDLELIVGKDCELMQSINLKDKNGKEGYSEDIAKDMIGNPPFIVKWDYELLARLQEIKFEIIGNVYENKELLK